MVSRTVSLSPGAESVFLVVEAGVAVEAGVPCSLSWTNASARLEPSRSFGGGSSMECDQEPGARNKA